jgi:type I restriction enzyme, R subunit
MTPEQLARQQIDQMLDESGWAVQNYAQMNIFAQLGVAIREFRLKTGHADYMLYADGKAIGVVEAKPEGHTLIGVETQSAIGFFFKCKVLGWKLFCQRRNAAP